MLKNYHSVSFVYKGGVMDILPKFEKTVASSVSRTR